MTSVLWNHLQVAGITKVDEAPSQAQWVKLVEALTRACGQVDQERRALTRALGEAAGELEVLKERVCEESAHRMTQELELTSLRERLEQRQQAQEHLLRAHAMAAIERVTTRISHDVNNLLQVMLSCCELLEPGLTLQQQGTLQQVREAAERTAHLTRDLTGPGRTPAVAPVIDLDGWLADEAAELGQVAGERVRLHLERDQQQCQVQLPAAHLHQILRELTLNAHAAMPSGGDLSIAVTRTRLNPPQAQLFGVIPGVYVVLRISDTGQGMQDNTKAHAFEPFYTTDAGRAGAGLGLARVFRLVTAAGGHVEIEASSGAGTTFVVRLPEPRSAAATGCAENPSAPPSRTVTEGSPFGLLQSPAANDASAASKAR